jgi:hypothetical protein
MNAYIRYFTFILLLTQPLCNAGFTNLFGLLSSSKKSVTVAPIKLTTSEQVLKIIKTTATSAQTTIKKDPVKAGVVLAAALTVGGVGYYYRNKIKNAITKLYNTNPQLWTTLATSGTLLTALQLMRLCAIGGPLLEIIKKHEFASGAAVVTLGALISAALCSAESNTELLNKINELGRKIDSLATKADLEGYHNSTQDKYKNFTNNLSNALVSLNKSVISRSNSHVSVPVDNDNESEIELDISRPNVGADSKAIIDRANQYLKDMINGTEDRTTELEALKAKYPGVAVHVGEFINAYSSKTRSIRVNSITSSQISGVGEEQSKKIQEQLANCSKNIINALTDILVNDNDHSPTE